MDLKYAYNQIPRDKTIQKNFNFNIPGGRATGTYRFINEFYGPTDIRATFQKTIDKHYNIKHRNSISRRHTKRDIG